MYPVYVSPAVAEREARSRAKINREKDKRARLQAELAVLRGKPGSFGSIQRWNYVTGGQRGKTWD